MKTKTTLANHQVTQDGSHHPSPTNRLSDQAFYLIALANLLRKTVEPGQLQQFLASETFTGLGATAITARG